MVIAIQKSAARRPLCLAAAGVGEVALADHCVGDHALHFKFKECM